MRFSAALLRAPLPQPVFPAPGRGRGPNNRLRRRHQVYRQDPHLLQGVERAGPDPWHAARSAAFGLLRLPLGGPPPASLINYWHSTGPATHEDDVVMRGAAPSRPVTIHDYHAGQLYDHYWAFGASRQ
ncbi:hypothetical protein BM221_001806 [Beauveria bassiana]|uniref:Uncharacterized protein n=1 Tax=Beauveria bassiana TaxID=176275 RepID=A0A2N6NWR3_BEABA|nr:hypothetical protein BM221_001806 [Beauveria bassiana]